MREWWKEGSAIVTMLGRKVRWLDQKQQPSPHILGEPNLAGGLEANVAVGWLCGRTGCVARGKSQSALRRLRPDDPSESLWGKLEAAGSWWLLWEQSSSSAHSFIGSSRALRGQLVPVLNTWLFLSIPPKHPTCALTPTGTGRIPLIVHQLITSSSLSLWTPENSGRGKASHINGISLIGLIVCYMQPLYTFNSMNNSDNKETD